MKRNIIFIIPHTHWDRAWYVTFEVFRRKLVPMMDKVLDLLEGDSTLRFTADGQTAMILDYLVIRTENRGRIDKLVRDGRLAVGPWYVLPDEFLVGGEALIRNLEMGIADSMEFGGVMRAGLMPDSFGHVAQLPQILKGFCIDNLIFSRGLHEKEADAEVQWNGLDGTTVTGLFQIGGYFNGANLGYPGGCDTEWVHYGEEAAITKLRELVKLHEDRSHTGVTMVHNGMDHLEMQQELTTILQAACKEFPDHDVCMATYSEAAGEIHDRLLGQRPNIVRGELTYPHGDMLKGVHSSRVNLKQANQRCEDLLTLATEPLEALAFLVKPERGDEGSLLRHAWRELLMNQPHDDICGCSCDGVHEENATRFRSVQTLLETVTRDALRDVVHAVHHDGLGGIPLVVHQPAPAHAKGTQTVQLEVSEGEWKALRGGVHLLSPSGRELDCALQRVERVVRAEVRNTYERMLLTLDVMGLDPGPWGFGLFRVLPGSSKAQVTSGVKVLKDGLENESLRVHVQRDGSLTMLHKASGVLFEKLNVLRDEGDRGDSYNWSPVEGNQTQYAEPMAGEPTFSSNGLTGSIQWRQKLHLPRSLTKDRRSRSSRKITLPVLVEVRLRAGTSRVDIRLEIDNRAMDHRLRVAFPVPFKTDQIHAGSGFASVARPIDMRSHHGYRTEKEATYCPTENFQRHLTLLDERIGLAIHAKGISEYEAVPDAEGATVLLTLLRATGWLSRDDLSTRPGLAGPPIETPGGQMQGIHVFEYALQPFLSAERDVVARESMAYAQPLMAERADFDATPQWLKEETLKRQVPADGPLPGEFFLVRSPEPRIVFTAFRRIESDLFETRLYNHSDAPCKAPIEFGLPVREVRLCRLDGEPISDIQDTDNLSLNPGPWEIVTLRFRMTPKINV